MPPLTELWIPILLSAVLVFAASSLIHMVFKWHNSDYRKLANEDEVRAAIRSSTAPGQYMFPHCIDPQEMRKPETLQKLKEGPNGMMMIMAAGAPNMVRPLALWFLVSLIVALAAGYLASRTVPAGASFLAVARVVGLLTFLAYATGGVANAIWMGKPWISAAKEALDAFIYGLVTAAAFGWLWPR